MVVYKFGGASVADSENIRNVGRIINSYEGNQLVVVVSAMGKTTNALEDLFKETRSTGLNRDKFEELVLSHRTIVQELIEDDIQLDSLESLFADLKTNLEQYADQAYDLAYDQIVSFGELISTTIIAAYLKSLNKKVHLLDASKLVRTDHTFREGIVDWQVTQQQVRNEIKNDGLYITQGFIGGTQDGMRTTLGREGSDFTAAILSFCLDAEYMAIWKDVPGILTADPRLFDNVAKVDRLSYKEAIEMTYYGAKVIHPKTIKPIQNKGIPLWVKSFKEPNALGTLISGEIELTYPPMIVVEPHQALIHISTKDFSFVGEEHLSKLFQKFSDHRVRINMMRNTAISFSVCTNDIVERIENLKRDIESEFNIVIDHHLELITIRHFTEDLVNKLKKGKILLFEERLQQTIQMVVKDVPDMVRK